MAYTKIITIKRRLDVSISYAVNPEKTDGGIDAALDYITDPDKTGRSLFVSAINCRADSAFEDMMATKRQWKKTDRPNKGYHIIQSFSPGEVTPEIAHKIGQEFASRLLGDKYEVVVSTHLDRGHYHNHIVFNSVSFIDGSMYRSTFGSYFEQIRGLSDTLCREYGLSTIEPSGKGKHYAEWKAEKSGQPTFRSTIREDIDRLILKSYTFSSFIKNLEREGYKVKYGPNIKYMSVRPPGGERFIRLASLKDERYSEQGIRERILRQQEKGEPEVKQPDPHLAPQARFKYKGSFRQNKPVKLHGFKALYFRYLYKLGKVKKKQYPTKKSRYMIAEMARFNRYVSQFRFLHKYGIETASELLNCKTQLEHEISELAEQRKPLYALRKNAAPEEQNCISDEIAELTKKLRDLRYDLRQCLNSENDISRVQEKSQELDAECTKTTKEEKIPMKNKVRSFEERP